jgi:hypothetical protein
MIDYQFDISHHHIEATPLGITYLTLRIFSAIKRDEEYF